jgi:hypothetical protein
MEFKFSCIVCVCVFARCKKKECGQMGEIEGERCVLGVRGGDFHLSFSSPISRFSSLSHIFFFPITYIIYTHRCR